jgi:hypothetical protein
MRNQDQIVLSTCRQPAEDVTFEEPRGWYKGEWSNKYLVERSIAIEDIVNG